MNWKIKAKYLRAGECLSHINCKLHIRLKENNVIMICAGFMPDLETGGIKDYSIVHILSFAYIKRMLKSSEWC
jgi:hypothetical protein